MKEIVSELSKLVEGFLVKNPQYKVRSLAAEAGIGQTTLYRILSKEQIPSYNTCHSILEVIGTPELTAQFMGKHFDSQDYLKNLASSGDEREHNPAATKALSHNLDSHRIMVLASKADGISTSEKRRFGENLVNKLLEDGALKEINGKTVAVPSNFSKLDEVAEAIKLTVETQKVQEFSKPSAKMLDIHGFSDKGFEELKELMQYFFREYYNIKARHNGNRACELGLVFGEVKK